MLSESGRTTNAKAKYRSRPQALSREPGRQSFNETNDGILRAAVSVPACKHDSGKAALAGFYMGQNSSILVGAGWNEADAACDCLTKSDLRFLAAILTHFRGIEAQWANPQGLLILHGMCFDDKSIAINDVDVGAFEMKRPGALD